MCYVEGRIAYFTTQDLKEQWGDDWNDAPYEHNAEIPYQDWDAEREKRPPRWEIVRLAFECPLSTPDAGTINSRYSVQRINAGAIAWLRDEFGDGKGVDIPAGTTLSEFKRLVKKSGGRVYVEEN